MAQGTFRCSFFQTSPRRVPEYFINTLEEYQRVYDNIVDSKNHLREKEYLFVVWLSYEGVVDIFRALTLYIRCAISDATGEHF